LNASDELKQLFDTTPDADNRRAIIQALGVAGNTAGLAAIAGDAKLPEDLRVDALHSLGVAGADDALVKIYAQANTPALHEAALQGLLIAGDSDAVLQLYRQAKTADEKKALLRMLSLMN